MSETLQCPKCHTKSAPSLDEPNANYEHYGYSKGQKDTKVRFKCKKCGKLWDEPLMRNTKEVTLSLVRYLFFLNYSQELIAMMLGIHQSTVGRIIKREGWKRPIWRFRFWSLPKKTSKDAVKKIRASRQGSRFMLINLDGRYDFMFFEHIAESKPKSNTKDK